MVIRRKKKKVKENRTGEKNQEDSAVREHILCGGVNCYGTNMYEQHERKECKRSKGGYSVTVKTAQKERSRDAIAYSHSSLTASILY